MREKIVSGLAAILVGIAVVASGCASSSPADRIAANPAVFESLSPVEQERVQAGRVAPGDSREMVLLALGEPDEESVRLTEEGEQVVWYYTESSPGWSIGIGSGRSSGNVGVGGSVTVGEDPEKRYAAVVRFNETGEVASVDGSGFKR